MKWLERVWPFSHRAAKARAAIRVTIEPQAIVIHGSDGNCTRTPSTPSTFNHDFEQALQSSGIDATLDQVAVTFDASAAHFDLLRWSAGLNSARRWEQFSVARLVHTRADDASRWSIRVLRSEPPHAAISAAVPVAYLSGLKQLVHLASTRIGLLDRINALLARDKTFSGCVVDVSSERAWIFVFRAGAIERVRLRRLQADISARPAEVSDLLPILTSEWAATGDDRELPAIALAGSHAAAAAVALQERYDGNLIALTHRQPRGPFDLDFSRRPPTPKHGWALATAGVISIAAAIAWALPDWQKRSELGATRSRNQVALANTQPPQPAAQTARRSSSSATARSRDSQVEARQLALELSKPWSQLFGALESSSNDQVRIVQVDVDSRFRQLHIHAEAKSLGELIRYAERLASVAPISAAHLAHHEWKTSGTVRVVTARLIAQLNPVQDREPTATASFSHISALASIRQ